MERDSDINPRTASMLALLAIEQVELNRFDLVFVNIFQSQNEPAFAMEVLGAVRAQNLTTVQNIRVRSIEISVIFWNIDDYLGYLLC